MAVIIREALNADQMSLTIFTGGQVRVGINLAGTWAGTVKFFFSTDGINFINNPLSVRPFASGTTVTSATANGNWEADVQNYIAVRAVFTRTSGTVLVSMATSIDSSYQAAFLASTSIYVTQEVTAGATNVITQAAQANRAWRLRTLTGAFSVAAGATVKLQITDGASTALWTTYVPLAAGPWEVQLPRDSSTVGSPGGVVNTIGNSMVVTLAAPGGSVVSELNCEFMPA